MKILGNHIQIDLIKSLIQKKQFPNSLILSGQKGIGKSQIAKNTAYCLVGCMKLEELIEEAHYNFGEVWHINCHSMPSASARPRVPIGLRGFRALNSDFVIGDRDGSTADLHFRHAIADFLKSLGHIVSINDPFKGVELVRRYSNPARGRHSIQIEINKALYMNETTGEKNRNYNALKGDIEKLCAFIADYARANLVQKAAD